MDRKKCRCAIPTYSNTEWGIRLGSGMVDAYCINHVPVRPVGQVPLEDWPWKDEIFAAMQNAQTGNVDGLMLTPERNGFRCQRCDLWAVGGDIADHKCNPRENP